MRHAVAIAMLLLLFIAPFSAGAEEAPAFAVEQCDSLIKLDASRHLCPYAFTENGARADTYAKLYEAGNFSDAPDGDYTPLSTFPFTAMPELRVANKKLYAFDTQALLVKPAGQLRFYDIEHGEQAAFFCTDTGCTLAPDGEYTTAHGLTLKLRGAQIGDGCASCTCFFSAISGQKKVPEHTFAVSRDKQEYIQCEDRE